ncbi:MAG: ABC transporter substrate-binding protein [Pseudomonadota bacterium]
MRPVLSALLCLFAFCVAADDEPPRYGGELNVGTFVVTLSALSWDPADWTWKSNHDFGAIREQLLVGDLNKSVYRGGKYDFRAEAFLPEDALKGELAESWVWETPLTLVIKLREGIMFTAREGVMAAREMVADDVVFSYDYVDQSPKRIPTYFDHIERVYARDKYTVVFEMREYNAEWAYRFGYGYYSSISPRETAAVDAKNWRNVVGSGPFTMRRYVQGNSHSYERNPNYWGKTRLAGEEYQLPFIQRLNYRIIKDEATYLTALRTGKLDLLESIRWIAVDHLKQSTPELKWARWLGTSGNFMALRMDFEPFKDIRVRRAINLAVNQKEIVDKFYGGHAELMAYPQHIGFGEYFQRLEEMPASVQELFEYKPEKARALMKEAGYEDGFTITTQVCSCSPTNMDLIPLLERYLAEIGIRMEIRPMEYASFLSLMTTNNHGPGYLMNSGHVNPLTTLRKSFMTGQTWNPALYTDPRYDEKIRLLHLERSEARRIEMVREMTVEILDEAPYLWLPIQYLYTAWWPWVKNYGGELRVGAQRPGPIYAQMWIDEEMKKEMGF